MTHRSEPTRGTKVSILVPVFNEEDNIKQVYIRVLRVFENLPEHDFELIFTDNHSTDSSFQILSDLARKDPRVRLIRYSRNCGYQRSLLVGYQSATGDCAVQIDADLQDPPELIPEMLALWRQGHAVVYGIRRSLKDRPMVAALRRSFYFAINKLSEDELPLNAGEFRLVDRRILEVLQRTEDSTPYLRGLISAMGFSQVGLEYDRQARVAGESKFPLRAMLSLAADGIVNHSLVPLRIASITSFVVGFVTFLIAVFYLVGKLLFGQDWPAGFATTTMLLLMSITLNAMFFGILGEYIGRIFLQTKRMKRPIIETELNPVAPSASEAPTPVPGAVSARTVN